MDDPNNPDSEYKNIFVKVEEDNTGSLLFGVGVNSDAGLTGSIVLNERNFDITRLPTSIDDLLSGNAFRGAGQEFRIEAVPGIDLQRYTASWREPFLFDSQFSLGVSGYYYERAVQRGHGIAPGLRASPSAGNSTSTGPPRSASASRTWASTAIDAGRPGRLHQRGGQQLPGRLRRRPHLRRPRLGAAGDGGQPAGRLLRRMHRATSPSRWLNVDYNKYFTVWQRADGSGRQVLALHSAVGWAGPNTPVYERFLRRRLPQHARLRVPRRRPATSTASRSAATSWCSTAWSIRCRSWPTTPSTPWPSSTAARWRANVEIKDYRVSAGVGVRIVVPMLGQVPIALDFGFPIVKAAERQHAGVQLLAGLLPLESGVSGECVLFGRRCEAWHGTAAYRIHAAREIRLIRLMRILSRGYPVSLI